MTSAKKYAKHLEIDPVLKVLFFVGFVAERLAAFAEPVITHGPGLRRSRALAENFFTRLKVRFSEETTCSESECRAWIAQAATESVHLDAAFEKEKNGFMTFTVLLQRDPGWWLFNLGPNLVLHVTPSKLSQLLVPHSGTQQAIEKGISREKAMDLAGSITAAVVPGVDFESQIRFASAQLQPGEWLLVAPESKGILDVRPPGHPVALGDIQRMIDQLAAPYAQFTRSWLAIGREGASEALDNPTGGSPI